MYCDMACLTVLALSNGITFLHVNDTRSMSSSVILSVKSYLSEFLQTLLLILLAGIVSFYFIVTLILFNFIFYYRFFFWFCFWIHPLSHSFISKPHLAVQKKGLPAFRTVFWGSLVWLGPGLLPTGRLFQTVMEYTVACLMSVSTMEVPLIPTFH